MLKPAKFDYAIGAIRVVARADLGNYTNTGEDRPTLFISKTIIGEPAKSQNVAMRLTAKKARDFAEWLEQYAKWAENLPAQGGR